MIIRDDGSLRVAGTSVYLDSRKPRSLCFVSHGHSDHICIHQRAIATPATHAFCRHRLHALPASQQSLDYRQSLQIDSDTRIKLLPAGHVYGSAMLHLTRPEGVLLYTGDFRMRRDSLTVEPADPESAEFLLMETTYGQPQFRFPPRQQVIGQLLDLIEAAFCDNRQPIVFGYSLGKAQELTRVLCDAGYVVTAHGAVQAMSRIHQELGVNIGTSRSYVVEDFHGPKKLDLRERGVLIAPPNCARSAFVNKFDRATRIMMTGWAMTKGAVYRYGVDHALPLSDHADHDELLELVARVRPKKVFTHHGFGDFAQHLRDAGIDATVCQEHEQLELFTGGSIMNSGA